MPYISTVRRLHVSIVDTELLLSVRREGDGGDAGLAGPPGQVPVAGGDQAGGGVLPLVRSLVVRLVAGAVLVVS